MQRYENQVEHFTVNECDVFICTDNHPQNPRTEWDNAGTMVCFHSRYTLGDKHDFPNADAFRLWWEEYGDGGTLLPVYLYDHSGQTVSTTPFTCPWDSGQVGWIYMTRERQEKEGIPDPIAYLKREVATYDQYLQGDIYGFSVEDKDGEILDTSWGYFGLDLCKEEATHTARGYSPDPASCVNRVNSY
jgi:hypothetical protein